MALPSGLWSMNVIGQYLQPDGTPHQGFVIMTPVPVAVTATQDGTPFTVTLQAARLDMDEDGFVEAEMLNPNDPTITPGPATSGVWPYCVRETFQRGPVIGWYLEVPEDVGDGDMVDLAKMVRNDEDICRPADWFPHHLIDTSVHATRISPRNGPLMRHIGDNGS